MGIHQLPVYLSPIPRTTANISSTTAIIIICTAARDAVKRALLLTMDGEREREKEGKTFIRVCLWLLVIYLSTV